MNTDGLRDLELAGVRWELAETPTSGGIAGTVANVNADCAPRSDVHAPRGVVPPAAPITIDATPAANAAGDMAALRAAIAEFNHPLRATATNVVLPHAAPNPGGLVIVTDIPGADDDASGTL